MEVTLASSRMMRMFIGMSALATLGLMQLTPMAPELRALAAGWAGWAALRALRRARAPARLSLDHVGNVCVGSRTGRLRSGSFVAPWLTTLRWRPDGAWLDRTLPVAPDMLGAEDYRRLRVLLKFGTRPSCGIVTR